jgi:NADH-quinone oxidoreductase subunit B
MTMPPSIGRINPRTDQTVGLDDRFFGKVNHELADRGFLTTSAESLVTWARMGSLMWMDLRARLLRDRNDADVDAAL